MAHDDDGVSDTPKGKRISIPTAPSLKNPPRTRGPESYYDSAMGLKYKKDSDETERLKSKRLRREAGTNDLIHFLLRFFLIVISLAALGGFSLVSIDFLSPWDVLDDDRRQILVATVIGALISFLAQYAANVLSGADKD